MKSVINYYLDFESEFIKEQLRHAAESTEMLTHRHIEDLKKEMMRITRLRLIALTDENTIALYLTSENKGTRELAELRAEELKLQGKFKVEEETEII